ncbi:outer membrane protein [Pontibaca methylaminivorans]|mgnify:CR=1 FL=1|uniref:outer membrane protein n=1 Tax=Pontibaca methylaminivorans TaxID=515897 RepID=UPI002FDB4FE4
MKKFAHAAALALLLGPVAVTPTMANEWTGGYFGLGIGWSNVDGPGGRSDAVYGLHGGYDFDFGEWVVGGEFEHEIANIGLVGGAGKVSDIDRLKLKGGYDFGDFMGYALLGRARMKSDAGSGNGNVFGIGVAYSLTPNVSLGGEMTRSRFTNFAGSNDRYDVDSLMFRASFRF